MCGKKVSIVGFSLAIKDLKECVEKITKMSLKFSKHSDLGGRVWKNLYSFISIWYYLIFRLLLELK